jgi:AcrR family transcriptional regulator
MNVTEAPTTTTTDSPHVRRRPSQARSQKRFDQVLEAASTLIAARGLEPVSMTDIAEEAGMALTALYRYFPNKRAIIRELALMTLEADAEMNAEMASDTSVSVEERIKAGVLTYCRHLNDPMRLQIRAAIHADSELSDLDLSDSRRNAATIAAAVDHDGLGIGRLELERRALLLVELFDGVVRLASRVDEAEAEVALHTFAEMATWMMLRPEPFTPAT